MLTDVQKKVLSRCYALLLSASNNQSDICVESAEPYNENSIEQDTALPSKPTDQQDKEPCNE